MIVVNALERELNMQVDRYVDLGYGAILQQTPREFSGRFDGLREAVHALSVTEDADMQLLTAVPSRLISIKDQLDVAGHRAYLKEAEMINRERDIEPEKPYILFGVELGNDLTNQTAAEAEITIFERGRIGFRLVELVALAAQNSQVFDKRRGYYAVDTDHVLDGEEMAIVDLYRYGPKLKVKRDSPYLNDLDWTTPSFAKLVTAE